MIKIICVGKIKESFYRDAILEYQKRLQKYTKLKIIEVKDYSCGNREIDMQKEMEEIEKYMEEKDYIVTLEIEGKEKDSIEFSKWLEKKTMEYSNITFLVGGSNGIHEKLKAKKNEAISFSKMTFPHPLFRVILLEQLYRAFKIQKNESYHK